MKKIDKQFENILNENNSRIKNKILEKLKTESGIPANWWDGRSSSTHTTAKDKERDLSGDTNFETDNSGQPDLEESAIGDVQIMAGESKTFKSFVNSVFNEFKDLEETKEAIKWLKSIYDEYMNESILKESGMGNLHTMASESKDFKTFIKDVFKEYKDLDKTKESVEWLKSIFDENMNESVNEDMSDRGYKSLASNVVRTGRLTKKSSEKDIINFVRTTPLGKKSDKKTLDKIVKFVKLSFNESLNEMAVFSIDDLAPDLIPKKQLHNEPLHKDLVKVINSVFKKYGINSIKLKENITESIETDVVKSIIRVLKQTREDGMYYDDVLQNTLMQTKGDPSDEKSEIIKKTFIKLINKGKIKSHLATGKWKHPYYSLSESVNEGKYDTKDLQKVWKYGKSKRDQDMKPFKDAVKKTFGSYIPPHVDDALAKAKDFNDFVHWIKRFSESINEIKMEKGFTLLLLGGSIGGTSIQNKNQVKGKEVDSSIFYIEKSDAVAANKRYNKQLSPGEKKYYGLKYVVVPVENGKYV